MKKLINDPKTPTKIRYTGYISDTIVYCRCVEGKKHGLWASQYQITRCPYCGRGYKIKFEVWQYEENEKGE